MSKVTKQVKRFDLGELHSATKTPQGFLMCPGFVTRVGVFPYVAGDGKLRRELRHPDDVFDPESLVTLKYAPVTMEHPPEMLTPENVGQYSKGHTTERVEINRDMVDADLIVEHKDAIDAVEGGLRELSAGYYADIVEEEGEFNGAQYNFRQKNIRYNHVAMVRRGRAGPEVRMRLDSADAVAQEISVPNRAEFGTESMSDSESTKKVVAGGKEWDLPAELADIVQDYTDRFDEMRAELSQIKEKAMATEKEKKDVDVSQKGVSPQVKVEQQGPDGRSAPGKTAAKPGSMTGGGTQKADDEEKAQGVVGGVTKVGKADDEEEKEDFEAAPAAAGGGAAMSPVEQLKRDLDETRAKLDSAQAKLDEFAAASMGKGESKPDRQDSAEKRIRERVRLERQAEKLVPFETAKKFDSMTDNEIRKAAIQHRHPKAELDGKSDVYLQSRFDSITEAEAEEVVESRSRVGRAMLGLVDNEKGERTDSATAEIDVEGARRKMIGASQDLWKSNLSQHKK